MILKQPPHFAAPHLPSLRNKLLLETVYHGDVPHDHLLLLESNDSAWPANSRYRSPARIIRKAGSRRARDWRPLHVPTLAIQLTEFVSALDLHSQPHPHCRSPFLSSLTTACPISICRAAIDIRRRFSFSRFFTGERNIPKRDSPRFFGLRVRGLTREPQLKNRPTALRYFCFKDDLKWVSY